MAQRAPAIVNLHDAQVALWRKLKPTIIVSGLGRCGSSLTMQMLNAAGVHCVGSFPSFEGPECEAFQEGFITAERWAAVAGRAVKLLDPHRRAIAWPSNLDL
ncbi:MAG: hypothetical protein ACYDD1_17175 [Caulobacteraceae bacterium]